MPALRRLPLLLALLALPSPAAAHRLDEYLQAAYLSVARERVEAEVVLTPGVAVYPVVIAGIDTDWDRHLSEREQRAYAEQVLRDLTLAVDARRLQPRLESWEFASLAELKAGRGEIRIRWSTAVPPGGPARTLTLENRHLRSIAAYGVNALIPADPTVRIRAQRRNARQSVYHLDYEIARAPIGPAALARQPGLWVCLGALVAVLLGPFARLRRRARAGKDP